MSGPLLNAVINSGNPPVELHTSWDLDQLDPQQAGNETALGNAYRRWIWSTTKAFNAPITIASSGEASQIQSWWRTVEVCDFTLNDSEANTTVRVQIMNQTIPLGQFKYPYTDLFIGTLALRAIDNSDFGANP